MSINRIKHERYEGTEYQVKEFTHNDEARRRFVDFCVHGMVEVNIEAHALGDDDEEKVQVISIKGETYDHGDVRRPVDISIALFGSHDQPVIVRNNIPKINRAKSYNSTVCDDQPSRKLADITTA